MFLFIKIIWILFYILHKKISNNNKFQKILLWVNRNAKLWSLITMFI